MRLDENDRQMLTSLHNALDYHNLMSDALKSQIEQILLVKYGVKANDTAVLDLDKGIVVYDDTA